MNGKKTRILQIDRSKDFHVAVLEDVHTDKVQLEEEEQI